MLSASAGDLPREYADRSSPKLFVSVLDSSTLEEATDNFSFRDFPQAPCPEQLVSRLTGSMELVVYSVPILVLDAM